MRHNATKKIEQYRIKTGRMASDKSFGTNGAFVIPYRGEWLKVIVSDGSYWEESGLEGEPWEHVSVSCEDRCPDWHEMGHVKSIFWGPDETVMQLHVPREDHVNYHPYCLHLWRPTISRVPRPPSITVGPASK